jgi:hypothetical protein
MQKVIRRTLLAAQLIAATVIATTAPAQSSVSGSIAITAQVVAPLQLIVTHALDFGRMLTATTKTIAPSAATGGRFELIGEGGSAVTVTLSMPSQLNPPSGSNLPVTNWTYLLGDSPTLTGTPVAFNAGTSDPIPAHFQTFAGTTKLYFGIGATVQASAAQHTTAYTGTGQITVAYSDL